MNRVYGCECGCEKLIVVDYNSYDADLLGVLVQMQSNTSMSLFECLVLRRTKVFLERSAPWVKGLETAMVPLAYLSTTTACPVPLDVRLFGPSGRSVSEAGYDDDDVLNPPHSFDCRGGFTHSA